MDDGGEGGLSFYFYGVLDTVPTHVTSSVPVIQPQYHNNNPTPNNAPVTNQGGDGSFIGKRRSFRQTVCRHWLRSLCMKGDAVGFYKISLGMPVCRFFRLYGKCHGQDCVYKHTNEHIKECNM